MENLFITNSKFDAQALRENKEFLMSLISQIKDAYIYASCKIENYQESTEIRISTNPNGYESFNFKVNSKGVISFESAAVMILRDEAKGLLKKYPNSSVQWSLVDKDTYYAPKRKEDEYGWVTLKINNITKENIGDRVKDIVITLESTGHAAPFILRR
jgi:hypothetical protein